ncbi:uncharacterized protein LOC123546554 [Mercenaria mercenaria]|uniref:uncharacterized protein LOC123546554 n=1 Tax=Mercenaria mercenaria TaxID=6596 RepID=UPI00234F25EC|nr:uncharacterized protein LOC123546554 [Mercenaria mercenaria]XP_045188875.2 uncharacterized protein LOC123546554 [Mercenaria mercenaria]
MSATEIAAPPIGPNIQGVQGPILEDSNPKPSTIDPVPGPDGRTTGEDVVIRKEPSQAKQESTCEKVDIEKTTASVKEELKLELDTAKSEEKVNNNVPIDTRTDMEPAEQKPVKGNAKVTEFKLPDKVEKDSGRGDDVTDRSEHVVDIVKQSKLKETQKNAPSELGEYSDFPLSRPLTETSIRDGTKMSYDTERERKEVKSEIDRDSKTPFSVKVERKPLHTAQTRSHSDYYSKSPSTSRFTHLATSLGQFYGFATDPTAKDMRFQPQMPRMRRPPKLVRLATVTMSPKTKPVPRGPSLYYEEPQKPKKVITWDEAMESRPPLRIDMEGPGPTNYSPRNRPLNETNSPAWTFGSKCFIEKAGSGSRTSWEKTWFQNPEVWTSKVDFYNDSAWPTPTHYRHRPALGPRQRTMIEAPSFTIGTRRETTFSKAGSEKEPSPVDYDKDVADKIVLKKAPAFSHQFRREGTVVWSSKEKVPGPGSYSPKFSYNKPHCPAFTIRSLRREKSHVLGPFSTF